MSKILVTGGAGFIGSHLCEELIKNNSIVVIDKMFHGNNLIGLEDNPNLTIFRWDILNNDSLSFIFDNYEFDTVFHFAANSDIYANNPKTDIDNTLKTTLRILSKCKKNGIKELVFASTSAIYGDTKDLIMESYGPLMPISHYGAAKLASEALICSYAKNYDIRSWICRFPNVIGGRATHGVIYDFINKINKNPEELEVLGNGEQIKPYLHVSELVDAVLFIWKNAKKNINIYNISGRGRTTVKDIAEMVIKHAGTKTKIKYTGGTSGWVGDCPEYLFNTEKLIRLGWIPKGDSDSAVKQSIREVWKQLKNK